jgi:hypothetical protein
VDYQLAVSAPADPVSADGPIPLILRITYTGSGSVTLVAGDLLDVEFDPPPGWRLDPVGKVRHLLGRVPEVSLSTGESFTRRIDLCRRFSVVRPGRVTIQLTVHLWPLTDPAEQPVVLRGEGTFDIAQSSRRDLSAGQVGLRPPRTVRHEARTTDR